MLLLWNQRTVRATFWWGNGWENRMSIFMHEVWRVKRINAKCFLINCELHSTFDYRLKIHRGSEEGDCPWLWVFWCRWVHDRAPVRGNNNEKKVAPCLLQIFNIKLMNNVDFFGFYFGQLVLNSTQKCGHTLDVIYNPNCYDPWLELELDNLLGNWGRWESLPLPRWQLQQRSGRVHRVWIDHPGHGHADQADQAAMRCEASWRIFFQCDNVKLEINGIQLLCFTSFHRFAV